MKSMGKVQPQEYVNMMTEAKHGSADGEKSFVSSFLEEKKNWFQCMFAINKLLYSPVGEDLIFSIVVYFNKRVKGSEERLCQK